MARRDKAGPGPRVRPEQAAPQGAPGPEAGYINTCKQSQNILKKYKNIVYFVYILSIKKKFFAKFLPKSIKKAT